MSATLIVGLGNPGRRYALTRHNVGFRCVDLLGKRHYIAIERRQNESLAGTGCIGEENVILAKPQTFMNLSGHAVRGLLTRHRLRPQNLIVVHDDLDLPLGRIRLRDRGSSGGHRGVQSIIDVLGTNEFRRVRAGIGRPLTEDPIEYVLRTFGKDEEPVAVAAIELAADAVECLLSEGLTAAMNKFNRDVML